MSLYPRTRPFDKSAFEKPADQLDAKYGLPKEVGFCKRCVMSNQKPNSAVEYQHTKESKKKTEDKPAGVKKEKAKKTEKK